jgi:hypothetical protein
MGREKSADSLILIDMAWAILEAIQLVYVRAGGYHRFKQHDAPYRWFSSRYGHECCGLDALNPNIDARLDHDAGQRAAIFEAADRESLRSILQSWPVSRPAHA